MSKWNTKRGEIYIPDMNPPKTYICKVCGSKIIPNRETRYTAKDRLSTGGINNTLNGTYAEPKEFDAFDCKVCGCQFIAKERLRKVDEK